MHYKLGRGRARADLGLEADSSEGTYTPTLSQGLAGAAAVSPFLGMIGEKPIIHDPLTNSAIPRAANRNELLSKAQAGDVLITGKNSRSPWKQVISPFTGSELYHAQGVVGPDAKGVARAPSAGEFARPEWKGTAPNDLMPHTRSLDSATKSYTDMVLMRPKKPMSPEQIEALQSNMLERSTHKYDTGNAVKAWFNDIFVPKIKGREAAKNNVICEGNMCSTLPSQALKEVMDTNVVPGKPAKYTMPADFMRSDQFEPVTSVINTPYKSRIPAGAKRILARSALGAGLAGATYATAETPELAAIPAGALVGSRLGARNRPTNLPVDANLINFAESFVSPEHYSPSQLRALRRQYMRRGLLPMALGAAGGTAVAAGLNQLRKRYADSP